jgi:preprotein translocase subunit SecA
MLKLRGIKHNVLNAKLHQREAEIVAEAGHEGTVTIATNMAGRGTDIKLSPIVRKAGGLAIVGTERHESRRVDRQLRGRAGRQGDPGSSQFFVSLEDDLMRLFGSDRIAGLMDRMGLKEGEVIQHSMITKSIERAQKKVEENNFGIRKRLLEYDDVMNSQREVVYTKRRHALFGERISLDIANMMYDVVEKIVDDYHSSNNYQGFNLELIRDFSMEAPMEEEEFLKLDKEKIVEAVCKVAHETYRRKSDVISNQAWPEIKEVYEHQAALYENIVVPITDGVKGYNIVTNLKKAYETKCRDLIRSFEKTIILYIIEEAWKEQLRELDDLKQSVQNATYEQKDPLLIYKFESFELFRIMVEKMNRDIISILMKGKLPVRESHQVQRAQAPKRLDLSKYETSKRDINETGGNDGMGDTREQQKHQPVSVEKKVGRNDPCPCGSGKKFKNCHGV